ncbi:MAG: serine/threonine protein kinase [candidate division Zixibacteria bacterium]|nr:serine/threonine protein kinase [candidate division Zixibacteria bacterium]
MADYERLARLGAGNFGEVWLVLDRALDVQRAVKYIPKSRIHDPTGFYKEPQTLMALRHDNIVGVGDAGKTDEGTLYIAMEYFTRGSVEDVYKGAPVPLSTAISIIRDICWALEYAHQSDIIHRDIKPANILLTKESVAKLSDFGLAAKVPKGATASPYGYLTHVAPEVLRTGRTSKASDLYALGVTAYRLINGDGFLPEVTEHDEIQNLILSGNYPTRDHYRPYVPGQLKKIVNRCMAVDAASRYESAAAFRKALESLEIHCDWKLRRKRRVVSYFTQIRSSTLLVRITPVGQDRFNVTTTKKVGEGAHRTIHADSAENLTLTQMKKRLRQILPRYVCKGK